MMKVKKSRHSTTHPPPVFPVLFPIPWCTYTSNHLFPFLGRLNPSISLPSLLIFSLFSFPTLKLTRASSLFFTETSPSSFFASPASSSPSSFPLSFSSSFFPERDPFSSGHRKRSSILSFNRRSRDEEEKEERRRSAKSSSTSFPTSPSLPFPGFLVLPDVSPSFSLDLGRASKQGVDKKSSFCANRSFHRRLFLSRQPTRPRGRRRRGRLDSTYGSLPLQHRRVSPSLSSLFLSQPHHPSNFKSSSSSLLYLSLSSFSQQVTFSGDAFLHSSQSPTSVLRERRRKWMEKNEQLSRLFMSPSPFSLTDFAQDSSSSPLGHHETPYDGDEDEDSSSSSPSFSGRMKGRGREEDPLGLSSSSSSSAGKRQGGEPFEGVLSNEELYQMYRQGYIYSEIEEEEESSLLPVKEAPFLIEGFAFNGTSPFASPPYGPMKRMVPYPRDLSFLPNLQHVDAPSPSQVKKKKEEEEERRRKDTDVEEDISHLPPSSTRDAPTPSLSSSLSSSREEVDTFLSVLSNRTKNWDFYGVPGSRYEIGNEGLLVTPPIFPNRVYYFTREEIQNDAYEDPYTDGSFVRHAEPSYLNPTSPALRTGRKRYLHRLSDTGKKQKKRWAMEEIPNDIPRGNWTTTNDIFKDLLDSIDWEREWPNHHDRNYYKRSDVSTLLGDSDRNEDSYFDPQFMGGVDTYPKATACGLEFRWRLHWIPWLCKKFPRSGGQPIKSEIFNLAGIEPLQVWFYPDGCVGSHPGFCALKLVSRPGWNLPFKINLSIQGSTVTLPISSSSISSSADGSKKRSKEREERGKKERGCGEETGGRIERSLKNDKNMSREGGYENREKNAVSYFRSCVETGPVTREDANYVAYSMSFCRLLDKRSFLRLADPPFPPFGQAILPSSSSPSSSSSVLVYNPETDVVLGASGDIEISVRLAEKEREEEEEERWEWDDGHWCMNNWLKLQSAYPDDLELEKTLPASFTTSDMYENYKYRDVPDQHFAKYLPSMLPPPVEGEDFEQLYLARRHSY